MFKRILAIAVIALFMLCGTAQAGRVLTSQIVDTTFNNVITTVNSTATNIQGYDKVAFFVKYDETEHVGAVKASHVAAGGTGYSANDILTITGGTGGDCTLKVLTVTEGAVATYEVVTQGLGYSVGDTQATTVVPSGGTNCTIHITAIGAVLSGAVTLEISYDNSNWMAASFYDYAGGATLQTSETISADGWYYCWFNKDLNVPYVRIAVAATNTNAEDIIDVDAYIVAKE
jgi:hypothetical protein